MFHSTCPSCGAPVKLTSSASAFAVCGFCMSSLARDGQSLKEIGKVGALLEDYSRVQIGATGIARKQGFTVVGRLQMFYSGGWWNEWHLAMDDGTNAWLSEASGQYAVTRQVALQKKVPAFDSLSPGQSLSLNGVNFIVNDKRTCAPQSAQGELPFPLSETWTARVVDLRAGDQLATLDYSDGEPVLYQGRMVKLEQMSMQLLRDEQTIIESAGRMKGKLDSLSCPTCAHSITAVPGGTAFGVCPGCGSALDVTSKTAELLEAGSKALTRAPVTTLRLGEAGFLRGSRFTIIGIVAKEANIEGDVTHWTEYLAYHPKQGFLWLSESSDGQWLECEVCDNWPEGSNPTLDNRTFTRDCAYQSWATYVAGSFNWLLMAGEKADVVEYVHQGMILSCETNAEERTWTLCTPIPTNRIKEAFSLPDDRMKKPVVRAPKAVSGDSGGAIAIAFLLALVMHLVIFLFNPSMVGAILGLGATGLLFLLMSNFDAS